MPSVQGGMWEPRPLSKDASPLLQPPQSHLRLAHVTTATPAKRITFYKSGDSQFSGVRMAVHKRSFKCFDALLDDLSQKMPLPFGVRTVTTPRGTHTIKHLEQLQDGCCYLCSDRRQAKPVNMEMANKHPNIWYHHSHRPHRPVSSSTTPPGHLPLRHRKILLVKNSEPGMRRSVVPGRRSTKSLRAFLDEVSEVMQFHVRKLYTAEGRRIDSLQSLLTCPGVLVCVGREAFSPMLINFIRKSSDDKLPGLGLRTPRNGARSPATQGARSPPQGDQSRASEYSEGLESKKNVNFGLETKKSIIHPRSDSSNRSTHFSLSSEKSFGNGVSAFSQTRPTILNEDIEKRVLVNKDGSLSLEMKVRFRLQNDETLQWSTQVKKSPSLTNECCPLSQTHHCYLQPGQSESCSDPESMSFDTEGLGYSTQPLQHVSEGNHCPCCYQRQEQQFDLWENPLHSHKQHHVPLPHTSSQSMRHTHSSSSSSSCNSRRVLRCQARLANYGGGSVSEQSQLVQEEMCMTEQVERRVEVEENGDTHVEMCRVSRCCSSTEVVAMDNNLCPRSQTSVEDVRINEEGGERPLSADSSSSNVLQSLKEDQDDKPPSNISAGSIYCTENEGQDEETGRRAVSAASICRCEATPSHSAAMEDMDQASCMPSKDKIQTAGVDTSDEDEERKRAATGMSGNTGLSVGSLQSRASCVCPNCGGCKQALISVSTSRASQRSHRSHGNDDDGSDNSAVCAQFNKSNLTNHGGFSAISNVLEGRSSNAISTSAAAGKEEERAQSATSGTSHRTNRSQKSGSNAAEKQKRRSPSAGSAKSSKSHRPIGNSLPEVPNIKTRGDAEGEIIVNTAAKFGASSSIMVALPTDEAVVEEVTMNKRAPSVLSGKSNVSDISEKAGRPDSVLSADSTKSNVSKKSGKSHRSTCSHCVSAVSPDAKSDDEPIIDGKGQEGEIQAEERAVSAMSAKSIMSAMTDKTLKSTKASERSPSPRSETGGDLETRAGNQILGRSGKSNKSKTEMLEDTLCDTDSRVAFSIKVTTNTEENLNQNRISSAMSSKSSKSQKSNRTAASPNPNRANDSSLEINGEERKSQERVASVMSAKSKSSVRSSTSHKSNFNKNVPPNPNAFTNMSVGDDDSERSPSATSAKSGKSKASSTLSNKSRHNRAADIILVETDAVGKVFDNSATGSESSEQSASQLLSPNSPKAADTPPRSSQQMLPGPCAGETRGPSALSVRSIKSAKSGRSNCCCGAISANKENEYEGKEVEKKDDNGKVKSEEALEWSSNLPSSLTERERRKSGGTELSLSRRSSGSVSLRLPEDEETDESDSGKSSVSSHTNIKRGNTVLPYIAKSTDPSAIREDMERTGSLKSNNNDSKCTLSPNPSAVDIPTIEMPEESNNKGDEDGCQAMVRAASAVSAKSSRSPKSSCNSSVKSAVQILETRNVKSKASNRDSHKNNNSSAISSVCSTANLRVRKSRELAKTTAEDSENNTVIRRGCKDKREGNVPENMEAYVHTESSGFLRPEKAASEQSDPLNQIKAHKAKSSSSVKTSKSQKKETLIKPSSPGPLPSSQKCLSHALSAADLQKENMAAARPRSQQSKTSGTRDKPSGERSQRSKKQMDQELDLTPACLPNASPSEVVSNWLRSIPANSSMLALGDEVHEDEEVHEITVDERHGEASKEVASPEDKKEEKGEVECDAAKQKEDLHAAPSPAEEVPSHSNTLLLSSESLKRNWHSSAAVMKVLLRSSIGRCQSMPEVSPVYGRRLSTSAKGFLDCVAQLQLIESSGCDQTKGRQYEDITAILQSLWLIEPRDIEAKESKDVTAEQVTPPRSSSGVGMSSGSGGSGKENGNQGRDDAEKNKTNEAESLHEDEGAEKASEKEGKKEAEPKPAETKQTTRNIAEEIVQSDEQSTVPPSPDSPRARENPSSSNKSSTNDSSKFPNDLEGETMEDSSSGTPPTVLRASLSKKSSQDPDPEWVLQLLKKLEKQFINHYSNAMSEFKVRWDLDDSHIVDTMICELREEVSRRIQSSIEREMKKMQSRAGRTGRLPRPPKGGNLSRESTMTERRRRMLRVMKNQSVKTADSLSDGEVTGDFSDQRSEDEYCPCDACVRKKMAARPLKVNPPAAEAPVMMDFDLRKILQLKKSPSPSVAPPPVEEEGSGMVLDGDGRNLEVVKEEDEDETKEDIKADLVLEETILEEDEEVEKDDGGYSGKVEKEDNSVGDEEQEEGETGGEEDETPESVLEEDGAHCHCQYTKSEEEDNQAGEVEERDAEEKAEGEDLVETSDNTGEDETAYDEEGEGEEEDDETGNEEREMGTEEEKEESEKDTAKEPTAGVTSEKEVQVPGKKEDDNASKNLENEESTLVDDFTEGNVSTSAEAEDEDDGVDGDGEEELHEEGESKKQERETSEEERASPQCQGITEGEEADAEDSDTASKHPSVNSVDEPGGAGATGDEKEKDERGDGDEEEEVKHEEVNKIQRLDGALLHQFTRTSVESQPGSLEDIVTDSSQNTVNTIEVPKMAGGGGAGQRRSRSPARVKRRKPKECDEEL